MRARFELLCLLLVAGAACNADRTLGAVARPQLLGATVAPNATNTLALSAVAVSRGADGARVLYRAGAGVDSTPWFGVEEDGTVEVPIVALTAGTTYKAVIELQGEGGITRSDTLTGTTGQLPAPLAALRLEFTGPPPTDGFILLNPMKFNGDTVGYTVAFDGSGTVRWYRSFHEGTLVVETKQQPNGNFTAFVGPIRRQPSFFRFVEFDVAGDIVREYQAAAPYYMDLHELLLTTDDDGQTIAHYFAFDFRRFNLSYKGGPVDTAIAAHRIIRQPAGGAPVFVWNSWDHFSLDDTIEPGSAATMAIDHPNSLDIDADGNYVVSWRNLGEVSKIDSRTGVFKWRLGGRNNQFTFVNDPLSGFSGQHSARMLDNGNLLLFDNGNLHAPPETRAVEYTLDLQAKTATLVWEFRHAPVLHAAFVGSVQRYENGNTLIGYGWVGVITEATPARATQWEAVLKNGTTTIQFYRAQKIVSLYRYQKP